MNELILGRQATEDEKKVITECNERLSKYNLEIIGTRPKDR